MSKIDLRGEQISWDTATVIFDKNDDETIVRGLTEDTLKDFYHKLTGRPDRMSSIQYVQHIRKFITDKRKSPDANAYIVNGDSLNLQLKLERKYTKVPISTIQVPKYRAARLGAYQLYDVGSGHGSSRVEYLALCITEKISDTDAPIYARGFALKVDDAGNVEIVESNGWVPKDEFETLVYYDHERTFAPRLCTDTHPVLKHHGSFRLVGDCEQGGMLCPVCGSVSNMYNYGGICEGCRYTPPTLLCEIKC